MTDPNAGPVPLGDSLPVVIDSNGFRTFSIEFEPQSAGLLTNTISFKTNDPDQQKLLFEAEGSGYLWNVCDLDMDDDVDLEDYALLAIQWLQSPGEPSADIAPAEPDNIVDYQDLNHMTENFLTVLDW